MILHFHTCINKKNTYLTQEKYSEIFGYQLTNIDYFVLEIANVIGESIGPYFEPNILSELLIAISKKSKTHLTSIIKQSSYLLTKPSRRKNIDFEQEFGIPQDLLPPIFRYKKNIGYFYLEFISRICAELNDYLCNYLEPESAYDITTDTYMNLLYFISDNCIKNCGNFCVLRSKEPLIIDNKMISLQ